MDIVKLQERIDKAQEKLEKKLNTIEKTKARLEKLNNKLAACKFHSDEELYSSEGKEECYSEEWEESWETMIKIRDAEYSIESNTKEVEKIQQTLKKYQNSMVQETSKRNSMNQIPDILKNLINKMIERNDKLMMNNSKKARSFEEIHKDNVEFSTHVVLDMIARTESVVGEITSWDNLRITSGTHFLPVFNGKVVGTKGSAMIETIEAGGYNIQRWHLRVLVKKL